MNNDNRGLDSAIEDVSGHKIAASLPIEEDVEDVEGHVQPRPNDVER